MKRWIALALAAACILGLAGCEQTAGGTDAGPFQLSAAEYPDTPPYPDEENGWDQADYEAWREDLQARLALGREQSAALGDFLAASARQLLTDTAGENRVYSPLNVYLALAMLAEVTDGESRGQILEVLGAESIEGLREQAGAVWNAAYRDDGVTTTVLASSLWLSEDLTYRQETLDALAEYYYASAFRGEMGSAEFDRALQSWLNEQTGGLLEEQAAGLGFDPETVLALAATIYFKAGWADEFSESLTGEEVFHSPEGDITCDFLRQSGGRTYYWGDGFSAVGQSFRNGGTMWFLLPDEGVSPEELLAGGAALDFLRAPAEWENAKEVTVHLSVPKFDVRSDLDLISGLQAMGITDVFDATTSDFTPLMDGAEGLSVTQAQHAARVTIDEEGCTAAAYTVIMVGEGAEMPPEEEVDFVLDRPFLFAITDGGGLPLFVGVVNRPV